MVMKPWKTISPKAPLPRVSWVLRDTAPSEACESLSTTPLARTPSKRSPTSCRNSSAPAADFSAKPHPAAREKNASGSLKKSITIPSNQAALCEAGNSHCARRKSVSTYSTVLFFHFLGLIGLFIGYGMEWVTSALLRQASTADQARSWLRVYRVSLPVSGPALLLLIATGGYLAAQVGGMKLGWILATPVGIVIALGIGFRLGLPRVKGIRAALTVGHAALSTDALARLRDPLLATLIRVRFFLAIGIVYLMPAKSRFESGLIA